MTRFQGYHYAIYHLLIEEKITDDMEVVIQEGY